MSVTGYFWKTYNKVFYKIPLCRLLHPGSNEKMIRSQHFLQPMLLKQGIVFLNQFLAAAVLLITNARIFLLGNEFP